jgi:phosphodiesterase/alkaline phosphatase D-like protein
MRSPSRRSKWTAALWIAATGCPTSRDNRSADPRPAVPEVTHVQPAPGPRAELDQPHAAQCVRYRRQHANDTEAASSARETPPEAQIAPTKQSAPEVLPAPQLGGPLIVQTAPQLSAGPVLGAIAADSVKVWVQADRAASWSVRVWPEADDELGPSSIELPGPQLTAADDFIGTLVVTGLSPRVRYAYSVMLDEPKALGLNLFSARGGFRTLDQAGEPTRTRVVVGADITGNGPQPIFAQIAALQPDFMLLIGDQIYADEAAPTREGYASFYRHNWNIKHLRAMLQRVPAFMIWDDHEIVDNYWLGKSDRYAPAREAYELYVQRHNPAPYRPNDLYYTLHSGDVAFFVMDVRSHRSPDKAVDDEQKSMLGEQQKQDLLDWLRCEPAKLKVIVSPVIWADWSMTGADAWVSFTTEREELLGYIAREQVGDVLLLSGDQHWSAVFRFERDGYAFYEFLPTPLSKTRGVAPTADTKEILARDDDNFVFGVVDIDTTHDPIEVALTLCALGRPCRPGEEPEPETGLDREGDQENVPFTIHLTERDLGRREQTDIAE